MAKFWKSLSILKNHFKISGKYFEKSLLPNCPDWKENSTMIKKSYVPFYQSLIFLFLLAVVSSVSKNVSMHKFFKYLEVLYYRSKQHSKDIKGDFKVTLSIKISQQVDSQLDPPLNNYLIIFIRHMISNLSDFNYTWKHHYTFFKWALYNWWVMMGSWA